MAEFSRSLIDLRQWVMDILPVFNQMVGALSAPGSPFAISEATIGGRTTKIYENAPPQVRMAWLAGQAPDAATYLVFEGERISWGQARERVLEVANALINDHGVVAGESVGISMRNYPEWILAWWAIQMAGAVAVEHNSFWNGEELRYGVEDSGSRVLICDPERLASISPHVDDIRAGGLDLDLIVARGDGDLAHGATHWESLNGPTTVPEIEVGPEDRSVILYTSGTTAFPKGVVHTQRNVMSNLLNMLGMPTALAMAEAAMAGEDPASVIGAGDPPVMLVAVPLFHVTGSHCVMMPITAANGTLVLMRKWNAEQALELIETEKVTNFTGVPTMTMDMLASPHWDERDTSSLTSMGSGGAPNPPHMVEKVQNSLENAAPSQGYGLSEVSGVATAIVGPMYVAKPGSCGLVTPVGDLKVIDDDGNELPTGERGELLLKGPHIFLEYHNKPDATADAIDADGWFHTGDIAIVDDEGFVFIVDRAKDVVIRGGENIGSAEVEAVVAQHDSVHECAVFGVPHERLGEEVAVAVHPLAGQTIDTDELRAFAAQHLAAFKVPAHVFVYDEPLPKNPNGKVLKRDLREQATA